jgi:hypothetical protein
MAETLRINQALVVQSPEGEQGITLSVSDWQMLTKRIRDSGDHSPFYHSMGTLLLGIGVSAALSAILFWASVPMFTTTPATATTPAIVSANAAPLLSLGVCTSLALTCLISGVISLLFSKTHREDRNALREAIVEDMEQKERRFTVRNVVEQPVSA